MKIVGREYEKDYISRILQSGRPEFVVVYGRRRIGKTYLIKEYFKGKFSFYSTGVPNTKSRDQLKVFHEALTEFGCRENKIPENWFEAFRRLKFVLNSEHVYRDPASGRRVVFLDELPWMDTARSDFKSALDYFWNSWASSQEDLVLIVCGSATSWIIKNLLQSTGGFYNRVSRKIRILPFTLAECEKFYTENGIPLSESEMISAYMVFGGIPYYLNLLDSRLSLAQNIESLCFREYGELYFEYDNLFQSLFKKCETHTAIIDALTEKKSGIARKELIGHKGISDGEGLSKALTELEQCGFIRKYQNFRCEKNEGIYQVTDPFILFSKYIRSRKINSWMSFIRTPAYNAWSGNAFETVCFNHIPQIKNILGISGIESSEYAWRSRKTDPGAQIDMLIDRSDGVINVCEIKYYGEEFAIDGVYEKILNNKLDSFAAESGTKKSLHLTFITANGLLHNEHAGIVINEITGRDLFKRM